MYALVGVTRMLEQSIVRRLFHWREIFHLSLLIKNRFRPGSECYCANTLASTPTSSSACSMPCSGNSAQVCGGSYAINVYRIGSSSSSSLSTGSPTTTVTSTPTSSVTPTSTYTSTSTSSPGTPPPSGKVVVAHHIVGNCYSYTQATWASDIALALAGGIDGFALNVGNEAWEPARVADAYSAAVGTSFKLFLSFDMSCVSIIFHISDLRLINMLATHAKSHAVL